MASSAMVEYLRANLSLPGQSENWLTLINIDNMGFMGIPYKMLKAVMDALQS